MNWITHERQWKTCNYFYVSFSTFLFLLLSIIIIMMMLCMINVEIIIICVFLQFQRIFVWFISYFNTQQNTLNSLVVLALDRHNKSQINVYLWKCWAINNGLGRISLTYPRFVCISILIGIILTIRQWQMPKPSSLCYVNFSRLLFVLLLHYI